MPFYLLLVALLVAGSAEAQRNPTDPCYSYRPDELSRLPPGVCSDMRGGSAPSRSQSTGRAVSQRGVFNPIAEARQRGLRTLHSAREHQDAINLARRLLGPAISRATDEIRRGERVAGPDAQIVMDAKLVLAALKSARIADGGDGCAVNPNGEAFVASDIPNTIHICPKLNMRSGRNRDREVMFILVHEGAHLSGISDEDVADEAASVILGWSMNG